MLNIAVNMQHLLHLNKDKKLKNIIALQQPIVLQQRKNVYLQLCASIMSQQLNTRVAEIIFNRFLHLYSNRNPTPEQIIETPFDKLRAIGLSNAKTNYIRNVSSFFIEEKITDKKLRAMENEELIKYLKQIKGVGQWTVEMILMFTLGREDVFALDDLAIQQRMAKLYNLNASDKKILRQQMIRISATWSPYRTYACRYLWGWKDTATKT